MPKSAQILAPISPGELVDKITILDIKLRRISDPAKLAFVRREHKLLSREWEKVRDSKMCWSKAIEDLTRINEQLWDAENRIRQCDLSSDFGVDFVELSRSIYRLNDERFLVKSRINEYFECDITEQKSYP